MPYKRITPKKSDFDGCLIYKRNRVLKIENVTIAKGGEHIETTHTDSQGNHYIETTRTANKGDYIITRDTNDRYILSPKTFTKNYKISTNNPDLYISQNTGPAFQVDEDTVLLASFGTDQYIKKGGYIYWNKNTDEIYGNQQHSFEEDFIEVNE